MTWRFRLESIGIHKSDLDILPPTHFWPLILFSYLSTDNTLQIMGAIPNKNVNILMQTSPLPVLHWQLSSCEIFKPFSEKLTPRIWGSSLQQHWDGRKKEKTYLAENLRLSLIWIVEEKFNSDLPFWAQSKFEEPLVIRFLDAIAKAVTAGISLTKEDSSAVNWWDRGGGLLSLVNTCGEIGLCTPCTEATPSIEGVASLGGGWWLPP